MQVENESLIENPICVRSSWQPSRNDFVCVRACVAPSVSLYVCQAKPHCTYKAWKAAAALVNSNSSLFENSLSEKELT